MDPDMKTIYLQDGIVQMYLNNTIYIDCSNKINYNEIIKQLIIYDIYPTRQQSFNEKIYMPLVLKSFEKRLEQLSPKLNSPRHINSYSKKTYIIKNYYI